MSGGSAEAVSHPWSAPPAEAEGCEVAPGVIWLRLPLPMALDHVNAYALDDGEGWTVVDPGIASRRSRAIWERILAGPLAGKPVVRVVVTHHHPDHIGLAGWFQREHGAELWTTRTAWLFARMLTLDEQPRPAPETMAFWKRSGMDPEILAQRAQERPFNFADMVAPLPLGFRRIRQGDVLRMGGRDWEVHVGGGHAPEQATFWSRDDHLVIGGDQLLPGISPNLGVYATEPEADPVADWLEACARLLRIARADHLVLPGHKLPFTGLPLRLHQKMDNHHHALERLLAHLDRPRVGGDCFAPLFKRRIDASNYGLALVEAVAHLNHLHQAGLATRRMGADGAWRWQRA
ncbi:MBL fold hydrolase [Rhodobacteraceae bacterium WD3A24]|nr:MBL fold hydrolase [Rhodobacteraceae bacterium WD3A24]